MKKTLYILLVLMLGVSISCSNKDKEFDDFDYTTVYFSYQYPVRTITLGEDFVDTSLDNEYKFQVMATLGGVYSNKTDRSVEVVVDETLVDGFKYDNGKELKVLPANYYTLSSNKMIIPKGKIVGGTLVQLSDAFFEDPLAWDVNYVLPMRIVNADVDSVLSGMPFPLVENPNRLESEDWEIQPKDFTLYAVRYVNEKHGYYLRRGFDNVSFTDPAADDKSFVRHTGYTENDEVKLLATRSLNKLEMALVLQDENEEDFDLSILLSFDADNNINISSPTSDYSASGTGKYVVKGEKDSWGQKDRDVIYLDYVIEHDILKIATKDTLVLRNRGVGMELFNVVSKE